MPNQEMSILDESVLFYFEYTEHKLEITHSLSATGFASTTSSTGWYLALRFSSYGIGGNSAGSVLYCSGWYNCAIRWPSRGGSVTELTS